MVAHGNPVYVEIKGHPLDPRPEAEYFLAWIDRLASDLKKRNRVPVSLDHINAQLEAARGFYQRLAKTPR